MTTNPSYFHLHLISDATGETLIAVGRAAAAQYSGARALEHVYPLVRNGKQLDRVLSEIERSPGMVLYTLIDASLGEQLEARCRELSVPCVSVLEPVLTAFHSYLGAKETGRVGAQHVLDADYFKRIEALNFTMMHDDGQLPEDLNEPEIIIVGISRTSKTPTSIYLANRGIKTANIPIVPSVPLPPALFDATEPLIVGLIASPDRIVHIRQNRLLSLNAADSETSYVNRSSVAEEVAFTRKLCAKHQWPLIDVTRRSIEESAAAIIALHQERDHQRENAAP